MAKLYGHANRLSQSFALTYALIAAACAAFAVFIAVNFFYSGSWQDLVVLVPLLAVLYFVYRKVRFGLKIYLQGMRGERAVAKILERELPDEYSIYRGIVADYRRGDIDLTVLGPTGLFTVEVKSHAGYVAFSGSELTRNGKPFEKNFLRQAKSEALTLRDFVARILHREIFVKAVLAFSSEHASVYVGSSPIEGVYVTRAQDLANLIMLQPKYSFPLEVAVLEQALFRAMMSA